MLHILLTNTSFYSLTKNEQHMPMSSVHSSRAGIARLVERPTAKLGAVLRRVGVPGAAPDFSLHSFVRPVSLRCCKQKLAGPGVCEGFDQSGKNLM